MLLLHASQWLDWGSDMSIAIHHGAPGSYKTAGVVNDVVIPAIEAGRFVVTNVRGLSFQRCLEAFPEAPETFDIFYVDTGTSEGREAIARWFHWVPKGALLVLDEAQSLFPKKWRQSDIDKLDFPGGIDAAADADRPHDWSTAWEMHRHHNWDVYLTTPSIKLIRSDIRECAEGAYIHKNMAVIGRNGRYIEGYHAADNNGSINDLISRVEKKISKTTWSLYDSTATGVHKDTESSTSVFKNPRLLFPLGLLSLSLGYVVYGFNTAPAFIKADSEVGSQAASEGVEVDSEGGVAPAGNLDRGNVGSRKSDRSAALKNSSSDASDQQHHAAVDYSPYGLTAHPAPGTEYSTVYRLVGFIGRDPLIKSRFGGPPFSIPRSSCRPINREWVCTLGDQVKITRFSGVALDDE